jgi:signal peptidase
VRRALVDGAALLVALLAVGLLACSLLGVDRYVIAGQSMGDAVPVGSLAFGRAAAPASLRRGDVVTFRPAGLPRDVTHRVVGSDARGLITRGDANAAADPWRLASGAHVRRVVAHVPRAGYVVAALREPALLGLLVALVAAGAAGVCLLPTGARRAVDRAGVRRAGSVPG